MPNFIVHETDDRTSAGTQAENELSDPREALAFELADKIQTYQNVAPGEQQLASEWVSIFRQFGFFRATQTAGVIQGRARAIKFVSFADSRPRDATTIFRVCDPARVNRISWTPLLARAMDYAPGGRSATIVVHEDAHLFSAVVEPDDVLAVLNDYEWIVDTERISPIDHGEVSARIPTETVRELPESEARDTFMTLFGADYPVQIVDFLDPYRMHDDATIAAPQSRPNVEGSHEC